MANDPFMDWTELAEGDAAAELAVNELVARVIGTTILIQEFGITTLPSASDYEAYVIADSGTTGSAVGHEGEIAVYLGLGWIFIPRQKGMSHYDLNTNTTRIFQAGNKWFAMQGAVTVSNATTAVIDAAEGTIFGLTLDGSTSEIGNPSNAKNGMHYSILLAQGGGGPHTVNWGSAYKWPSGTAPTLSTGGGEVDLFHFARINGAMWNIGSFLDLS